MTVHRPYQRKSAEEDIPDRSQRTGSRPKATALDEVADLGSVPPPPGDVHGAATTIAHVSDALLENLREGCFASEEASTRPRMVQMLGDDAVVVADPTPAPTSSTRPSPRPVPAAPSVIVEPAPASIPPLAPLLEPAPAPTSADTVLRRRSAAAPPRTPRAHRPFVHPSLPPAADERAWLVFFLAGLMTLVAILLAWVVPRYL